MIGVSGLRVLLVEDESLVALYAEDVLIDEGCHVVLAMRLPEALKEAQNGLIDIAVLDVNLGAVQSYPVANELRQRAIPFIFATGYGRGGLELEFRDTPTVQKPYRARDLIACIAEAMSAHRTEPVSAIRTQTSCAKEVEGLLS